MTNPIMKHINSLSNKELLEAYYLKSEDYVDEALSLMKLEIEKREIPPELIEKYAGIQENAGKNKILFPPHTIIASSPVFESTKNIDLMKKWPVKFEEDVSYEKQKFNTDNITDLFEGTVEFEEDALIFNCTKINKSTSYFLIRYIIFWPIAIFSSMGMVGFCAGIRHGTGFKTNMLVPALIFGALAMIIHFASVYIFKTKAKITVPYLKVDSVFHFLEKDPNPLFDKRASSPQETSIIGLLFEKPGVEDKQGYKAGIAFSVVCDGYKWNNETIWNQEVFLKKHKDYEKEAKLKGIGFTKGEIYFRRAINSILLNSMKTYINESKFKEASLWRHANKTRS